MADNGNMGNLPKLPSGGSNNNHLRKRDYDILDPEAKPEKNLQEKIDDAGKTAKRVGRILKFISPWIGVILSLLIIIGLIVFLLTIPGLIIGKLKEIAQGAIDSIQSLFTTTADAYINADDVVDLANYLEEMDYDLIGYGFLVPNSKRINSLGYPTCDELEEEGYTYNDSDSKYYDASGNAYGADSGDGLYYNSLGILMDNDTGQIVEGKRYIDEYGIVRSTKDMNSNGVGKIVSFGNIGWLEDVLDVDIDTTLLKSYLLSDYKIYAIRNKDDGILNKLYSNIKQVLGGYRSAWTKGLMVFFYAEDGIATDEWSSLVGGVIYGDTIKVNGTTLSLKNGHFNNKLTFDIDGWADRYGLSLEFLLSLHIGTMAPDLVYAMLQSFDTEVQVYLDDSGDSEVEAEYVDMMNESATTSNGITFSDINEKLSEQGGIDLNDWLVNSTYYGSGLSSLAISKADAQYLLDTLPLESPPNCTGGAEQDIILTTTYNGDDDNLITDYVTEYAIATLDSAGIDTLGDEVVDLKIEDREVETDSGEYKFKALNCLHSLVDEMDEDGNVTSDGQTRSLEGSSTGVEDLDEDSIIGDDYYQYFYDTGHALGYSDEFDEDAEVTSESIEGDDTVLIASVLDAIPTNYKVKVVKTERTWSATARDVDGNVITDEDGDTEEVEYTWITYKFIYYKLGEWGFGDEDSEQILDNVLIWEYIIRNKTYEELLECGAIDENGNEVDRSQVCSAVNNGEYGSVQKKCCKNCQKYVKKVVKALAQITDESYKYYMPYIARVLGSWFRDTYFVIPEEKDEAIDYYLEETGQARTETEIAMVANSYGSNSELVIVDEEYLADTGEYWTAYEMKEDDPDEYQLYYLNPDGTTSDTTMEKYLEENGYSSQAEAEEDGIAFVKKAQTKEVTKLSNASTESDIIWQAYGFDSSGATTGWVKINEEDDNEEVNKVYKIIGDNALNEDGGFYYNLTSTNSITQTEDAQRSQTNSTIKYLFKYRKYYIYDGTTDRAEEIAADKELVLDWATEYLKDKYGVPEYVTGLLGKYGRSSIRQTYSYQTITLWEDIVEEWLNWQLDMLYSGVTNGCPEDDIVLTDDIGFMETTDSDGNVTSISLTTDGDNADRKNGDPRNPDLIGTVTITKTSLNAFSILENTKTLAAEYAYRDFKELIVELDYFDKEDLSDAVSEVFTWVLPDDSAAGWPVRPWDKQDSDYGALIESADTYSYLKDSNYEVSSDEDEEESSTDEEEDTTTTTENKSITDTAQEILDTMISDGGWKYGSGAASSWEKARDGKIAACASYVSWVLQEAGYLEKGQFINHGDGSGADMSELYDKYNKYLTDATWEYPDCTTTEYELVEGDVVIVDKGEYTTIAIYAGQNSSGNNTYYTVKSDDVFEKLLKAGKPIEDSFLSDGTLRAVIRFPDQGEEETVSSFEGWQEGDLVASPVTGKVIEYGTHTRVNVYTEEEEEVGYIVIEAMSSKYFTEDNVETNSEDTEGLSDADAQEGLNYFYDEYEDTCSGYTITIDGFDVDLNLTSDSGARGAYEQNEIMALFDSSEQSKRELQEQAKEDAPFVVVMGDGYEIDNFPSQEEGYTADTSGENGIYIKEGKYIGTCVSTYEGDYTSEEENTSDSDSTDTTDDEAVTSDTYDGPAEYIRIMVKDTDYSIIDNVEDFFDIPEEGETTQSGNQEYQFEEGDLELLADAIHHEGCGSYDDPSGSEEDQLYLSISVGYTIINKLQSDSGYKHAAGFDWAPDKSKLYNLLCVIPCAACGGNGWYAISDSGTMGGLYYRANAGEYEYCDLCMQAAEYIKENDSMNFKNNGKYDTDYSEGDGMPHTCWEQGASYSGGSIWAKFRSDYLFDPSD